MTTISFTAANLAADDYRQSLLSPPDATPISGDIVVRGFAPFIQPEQKIVAGSWESEPGISRWEFLSRGEFIHVIAGRMTVQEDGRSLSSSPPECQPFFRWAGQASGQCTKPCARFL